MCKEWIKNLRGCIILLALVGLVHTATAVPYVILTNNKKISGSAIRVTSSGDYVLTIKDRGPVTFKKSQVKQAVDNRPAEYTQAVKLIKADDPAKAIPLLKKVIVAKKGLGWDRQGMVMLGVAQTAAGQSTEALRTYDKLFKEFPEAKAGKALFAYGEALIGAGRYDELDGFLKDVIAKGDRATAARAQVLRGDARAAQGDHEGAVMNYLRTAILFGDVPEYTAEAHYKAGLALKQMKDPRAKKEFGIVVSKYASSDWAAKAKAEL